MNSTPTLEGYGVRLLPLTLNDLPALLKTQDSDTWTWMSESGATPQLMEGFVQRALAAAETGRVEVWTVTILHGNSAPEVAGCSRLADLDRNHRTGEIGWTWMAPAYRGRGLNPRVKFLQLAGRLVSRHKVVFHPRRGMARRADASAGPNRRRSPQEPRRAHLARTGNGLR